MDSEGQADAKDSFLTFILCVYVGGSFFNESMKN